MKDCVGIKLETMAGLIHVICIYGSPSLSKVENRALLNEIAELQEDDNSELIIVGDFNLPDINWVSGRVLTPDGTTNEALVNQNEYMDIIIQKGLVWHITNQITRRRMVGSILQESTLDQVFTSNANLVEDIRIVSPIGRSDHLTIMVDLRLFDEVIFMLKEKKNYAKCDWDRVRQLRDNNSSFRLYFSHHQE